MITGFFDSFGGTARFQTKPGDIFAPSMSHHNRVVSVPGCRVENSGATTPTLSIDDHCTTVNVINAATTGIAAPVGVVAGYKVTVFNNTGAAFTTGIESIPNQIGYCLTYDGTNWLSIQSV